MISLHKDKKYISINLFGYKNFQAKVLKSQNAIYLTKNLLLVSVVWVKAKIEGET